MRHAGSDGPLHTSVLQGGLRVAPKLHRVGPALTMGLGPPGALYRLEER